MLKYLSSFVLTPTGPYPDFEDIRNARWTARMVLWRLNDYQLAHEKHRPECTDMIEMVKKVQGLILGEFGGRDPEEFFKICRNRYSSTYQSLSTDQKLAMIAVCQRWKQEDARTNEFFGSDDSYDISDFDDLEEPYCSRVQVTLRQWLQDRRFDQPFQLTIPHASSGNTGEIQSDKAKKS